MMMSTLIEEQAPVPPPSFQRGQARLSRALHIDALTLVRSFRNWKDRSLSASSREKDT